MAKNLFAPPTKNEIKEVADAGLFAPPSRDEIASTRSQEGFMDRLGGLLTSKGRSKLSKEATAFDPKEGESVTAPLRTGARSMLEMATLGASEPALSAVSAVDKTFSQGVDALRKKILSEGGSDFDVIEALKSNYGANVDQRRTDKQENPIANVTGGIAGAFMPGPATALLSKTTGLVGKGAAKIAERLPTIDATTKLGRVAAGAGKIAKGAATGSAMALAFEAPRQVIEGSTGFIKQGDADVPALDSAMKVGGVIGGSIPAVGMAARAIAPVAAKAGKKLMTTFLGPSEEHINYYMENPQAVNGAKSITELKDKVDDIVEGLRGSVQKGELSVAEARAQLRDVEQSIAQHRANSNLEFSVTSTQIKQQFRAAKKALGQAIEKETQALKSVKAPTEMADEAVQATRDLKDKVVKGSQDATELLQGGESIDVHSPYRALKEAKERLSIAGQGPITPQAQAAAGEIDKLLATFGRLPSKLNAKEAKSLIQQIDQSERALYNSGEFTDDVSQAYKQLRRAIDEQLKTQNPKYAEAMKGVASNRGLMDEAAGFQEKGGALSRLNRVASPTAAPERDALIKLGDVTGRDFKGPIEKYQKAQGLLKDPAAMQRLEQGLPEYQAADEAEKAMRMLEGPEAKNEFLQRTLKDSGLLSRQEAQAGLLAREQQGLLSAQGKLEPFKSITPRNSQSTLERGMRGTDSPEGQIQLKRQLDDLSKLSDVDFVKALKDLRVQEGFKQGATRGSRNVNLFAAMGAGAGAMVGGAWGATAGGSAGAALGGIVDKFGPTMAKQVLDGVLKIQGSPTLAKINALKAPPEVKAFLSREFAQFNEAGGPAKIQKVTDKDTP